MQFIPILKLIEITFLRKKSLSKFSQVQPSVNVVTNLMIKFPGWLQRVIEFGPAQRGLPGFSGRFVPFHGKNSMPKPGRASVGGHKVN